MQYKSPEIEEANRIVSDFYERIYTDPPDREDAREVCDTCRKFHEWRFEQSGRRYDGWCLADVIETEDADEVLRVPNKHHPCGRWDAQGEPMWRGL